ncbi:MAG TPA: protein kinase [Planctomycetota bacterium]|nr:protein kinase [Planctomycetota bacterium]
MKVDPRSFKGLSRFLAPSAGGPVADRAVSEKLITSEQLQECVDEQDRSGRPLDEILLDRGFVKAEDLERLRAPAVPADVVPWIGDPSRQLGHYILVSLLGTGGMAEVWKAWDRSLGRWVAVKYLKEEIGHPTQRIEREGRMAGGLSHPSIISIFERGQQGGRPYLVMPFVDGRPPKSPLPPREAARLALEVARALSHAHEAGIIHRDIKPANILVEAGGRIVLADFGLAILDDTSTSRWAMSGTPEYASPEQIRGDTLDARTDIYSLGATLYHLLSGQPPFSGTGIEEITLKVLKGNAAPLRDVPGRLSAIVRRAMDLDRERRFRTVGEMATQLESWVERSRSGFQLRPIWIGVAVLSVLMSWGATLVILLHSQGQEDRQRVLQALREGDRKLTRAERRRGDPGISGDLAEAEARAALAEFTLAQRWAGGGDLEAAYGIGRCQEFLGNDARAEEAYREAEALPAARTALCWLWGRRLLEGRKDRDWKAFLVKNADPRHLARAFAEGKFEEVLSPRATDRDEESLRLLQGAAALELSRWDDALRLLEDGLRLRPRDATLLYYRGLAQWGKGDTAGAQASWKEALQSAPNGWPLQEDVGKRLAASARR